METLLKRSPAIIPPLALKPESADKLVKMASLDALGIRPGFAGADRGINTQADVLTQTIDGRDLNDIWQEFSAVLAFHNAQRTRLVNLLTFPVTQPIEDVPQISGADFERASEFGVPKSIRGGGYFSVGYDFDWYDLRIAYTWKYLADATAAQVQNLNNQALEADNRLVFWKIMNSVFSNADRQTTIRQQSINVLPFYNGDGVVPPSYKNNTFDGNHNHFLVSGANTVDPGDLDDMEEQLVHHGYGRQNGASLILLAPRSLVRVIRNFRISNGASFDFIPAQGQPPFLLPTNTGGIQGGQPANTLNGMPVAGVYGPWTVIEEDFVPNGYMFGFATGGDQQATNPIGLREHQQAGLRGLRTIPGNFSDYPLIDSFYQRGFGTGVRHRGAGVVMQIKASGTYDVPVFG